MITDEGLSADLPLRKRGLRKGAWYEKIWRDFLFLQEILFVKEEWGQCCMHVARRFASEGA